MLFRSSGRGIALILSGWRGFYTWLGREGLIASNPVQDVRAPKAPKPLPKALSVDEAVQLASFEAVPDESAPGLEARDHCITELLYGCGLRIGELVGLDVRAGAAARGWIDTDSAEAHVLGKGSKRRSVPVGSKAVDALLACLDDFHRPCRCRHFCPRMRRVIHLGQMLKIQPGVDLRGGDVGVAQ